MYKALLISAIILMNQQFLSAQNTGIFESSGDVGNVKFPGAVYYAGETGVYTLSGAGANMWGSADEFRYLWSTLQGDFILRAEMKFIGEGVDPHRKIGWVVRNTLSGGSPMVNAAVHGDGLTSLQFRKTTGGETLEVQSSDKMPDVVQLARIDGVFYMSTAVFGEPFTTVELSEISLRNQVFAGIYICSHNPDVVERATFRNVRIVKPAGADLVPYQDYLGSRVEIMDVATGNRKVVLESEHSLQAPNWTTDGKSLIYNSNGFLYQYDIATGETEYLNTGFATNNNNDHVLSLDGKWLGISHHNSDDDGASTIYMLPSEGSDSPRQVTASDKGASYLHGISPDNSKVIFTGYRNGKYDLYEADVETMQEKQLTDTPGLDDGSEYSPDGKYIYFNSTRTGTMKLWRMKPDGSQPEQLTFDDNYNDWFPHISPDGQWIVFISYGTDVEPGNHPFYKQVTLRIMPADGGEPRIIAYLYGGQGTINVPSWSPDSKRIAFVSNSGRFY